MQFECKQCGCSFERKASHSPDYCSKRCYGSSRKRRIDNPFRWTDPVGYVRLKYWDDERRKYCHVFEHRFVWERANGPVPDGFVVHHVNEAKDDNRLENLALMPRGDHVRHHTARYADDAQRKAEYARRARERRKVS